MRVIALALTLIACGAPRPYPATTAFFPCTDTSGFQRVQGETFTPATDGCQIAAEAMAISEAILSKSGFAPVDEIRAVRANLEFTVLAVPTWDMAGLPPGAHVGGLSEDGETIVGSTMWSTLHEEIHQIRMARGVPQPQEAAHEHWDEPGYSYVALTDLFVWAFLGARVCNAQAQLSPAQVDGLRNLNGIDVEQWLQAPCR